MGTTAIVIISSIANFTKNPVVEEGYNLFLSMQMYVCVLLARCQLCASNND